MRRAARVFPAKVKIVILFALVCSGFAGIAQGQTIQPVLSEYRGQASGRFELTNDSFYALNVVLEPKSFAVSEDGEITYGPLDSDIHVKFSATSFRIPPKQSLCHPGSFARPSIG